MKLYMTWVMLFSSCDVLHANPGYLIPSQWLLKVFNALWEENSGKRPVLLLLKYTKGNLFSLASVSCFIFFSPYVEPAKCWSWEVWGAAGVKIDQHLGRCKTNLLHMYRDLEFCIWHSIPPLPEAKLGKTITWGNNSLILEQLYFWIWN